jgi:hypothetical protein
MIVISIHANYNHSIYVHVLILDDGRPHSDSDKISLKKNKY